MMCDVCHEPAMYRWRSHNPEGKQIVMGTFCTEHNGEFLDRVRREKADLVLRIQKTAESLKTPMLRHGTTDEDK